MDTPHSDLEAIRQILADLTSRVYRIEQKLELDSASVGRHPPSVAETASPAVSAQIPPATVNQPSPIVSPPAVPPARVAAPRAPYVVNAQSTIPPRAPYAVRPQSDSDLESRIGSHWLNRIGIAALLIGISYFLKFAFDNNWIGPTGRVTIGLLAGVAVVAWSERFRRKGYLAFSYSLKAVGIGALYLSSWAAFQVYALVPGEVAFFTMIMVTAATAAMALAQDAQILAAFALMGGFTTPLLLSTGQNHEAGLFAYLAILDLATLALVTFKPWRRLLLISYAGTFLLYVGWYSRFYNRSELEPTLVFATLFFTIFAIAPLITIQLEGEIAFLSSIPATLAFVNAVVYFLQVYVMIWEVDRPNLAWFAVGLASLYIILSRLNLRGKVPGRANSARASERLRLLHLALAIGFITVAIPIRFDAHWITIGWFVEAGALLWMGDRIKSDLLNIFALGALALGVVRLLLIDNFDTTQLFFNLRMGTYGVAVAVLGLVAWYASKRGDDSARSVAAIAIVALNVLALVALTREVTDYYVREMFAVRPTRPTLLAPSYHYQNLLRRFDIERDFTYSALWMAYGAVLMIIGFLRRSAFVRWQALVLIAATTIKVFVYDVSQLDRGYRIVSFIVLGVLLLAISFVYQRDLLNLSARTKTSTVG
jgi:uncharacterized membrane protein